MDRNAEVVGIVCDAPLDEIIDRFASAGFDAVLLNPRKVYGRRQCLSAVDHAERAFSSGTNRSRDLPAEIMMYMSGERQASRAIRAMKPDSPEMVAIILSSGIPDLQALGMAGDDSLIEGTPEKAAEMGLDPCGTSVSYEQLALEKVAMLDIEKQ